MPFKSTDLRWREQVIDALIEQSQDTVTVATEDGTILFKSAFAQEALGYAPEALNGKSIFEVIDPDERPAAIAYFTSILKGQTHADLFEYRMMHRDGSWRYFTARPTLLEKPVEGAKCVVIVSREVTRRKLAEDARRASGAHKTAIFENALDAIITMNGAGNLVEWNAAAEQLLGYSREEMIGRELSELIIPPELREVHGASLARYIAIGQERILGTRIEVPAMRCGGEIEIECESDSGALSNAPSFPAHWTTVRVRDSGIGIAPEKLSRLFTPCDRLDAERTGVEGTSLGLALTKKLIEEMGGELSVGSTPGVGSTFSLRLPTADALPVMTSQESSPPIVAEENPDQRRLLLIEDNPRNVRVIEKMLERRTGITMMAAMNGSPGLELARKHRPDAIALDLHLPDIGGREVLDRLREDAATRDIPVLILSADATPGQIGRLKKAGAHEYLTRPLDVAQFFATLDEVFRA